MVFPSNFFLFCVALDVVSSFTSPQSMSRMDTRQRASTMDSLEPMDNGNQLSLAGKGFQLDLALFSAGLAFDAYVEPPPTSSRWERGSKGMNVAFVSAAFTRNLYKAMVEVTPLKCSGLPEEDDSVEALMSGGGVDASVMVAAIEGQWKEDIELLKQEYHEGITDLTGAAHIGRSSTAWSNIDQKKSMAEKQKTGKAPAYHIKKSWGTDASAVWPEEEPFYIYVQDPKNAKLLFTLFDDDVIGEGSAIGSTYRSLVDIFPQAKLSEEEMVAKIKQDVVRRVQSGGIDASDIEGEINKAIAQGMQPWEGDMKLTSKPRIKNKNSQVAMGMAAGAMVAGPVGAALGAAVGSMYEGAVKGRINVKLRYMPIPQTNINRDTYLVTGGMPGIEWGSLYSKYLMDRMDLQDETSATLYKVGGSDLEHCFFINHDQTGACCAVYRSLERKLIVVSFRGTCAPIDLVTDASIVQEPWVEGEDGTGTDIPKVHVGFRKSLNSISRRLKELILATVEPGERLADYDMLVTGHSLGGALATLFVADIGEFGVDAGRALPSTEPSDQWWKSLTNRFMGNVGVTDVPKAPPRPKGLYLYNFGSPRVGNKAFSEHFGKVVQSGNINQAYRIVNGQDVVARMPRTMRTLSVNYDHCGSTVLVQSEKEDTSDVSLWIEGESDSALCPVRDDEEMTTSPTAEGTLLGDILAKINQEDASSDTPKQPELGKVVTAFKDRLSTATVADLTSVVGIRKSFSEREFQMIQSLLKGEALAHHMEDSYYGAMGRAGGFEAVPNEPIVPMQSGSNGNDAGYATS